MPLLAGPLIVVLDGRQGAFRRSALWEPARVVTRIGKATLYRLTGDGSQSQTDAD